MKVDNVNSVKNKTNNPNGRPKGTSNKLRVTDFFNGAERDELIANAKLLAFGDPLNDIKPDKDMIKFCWEQLFGKATQRTELTGLDGEGLKIFFDKSLRGD
jgi:hypothetical protein